MKIGPWLAVVALAAVGGFLAGRNSPESGAGNANAKGTQPVGGIGTSIPSKGPGSRAERGGKGAAKERRERRMNSLRELLNERERNLAKNDDPFGDNESVLFDDSRLHALIYEAAESDFPAILDLALENKKEGEPGYPYGRYDVIMVMLRRWSDFDSKAAMQWLKLRPEDQIYGWKLDLEMIVAAEAIDSDPEWALGKFAEGYQQEDVKPELDPFGGDDGVSVERVPLNLGGDSFFYRFTTLHPDLALEAMRSGIADFWRDGSDGWMDAMFELGRGEEIPGLLAGAQNEVQMLGDYGRLLLEHDPQALQAWLENRPADSYLDLQVLRNDEWGSEAWLDRVEWYLDRGTGEGAARRMVEFTQQELTGREGADEILATLQRRGVAVESSRAALFWGALNHSAFPDAYRRLEDVPAADQERALENLFGSASRSHWIRLGDLSMKVFESSESALDLAEQNGYGETYRAFIRQQNEEAAAKVLEFIETRDAE